MHRRTYERLRAQADAADAEADALLVGSMPGLKELLADSGVADPAPPRPKRQRRRRDGGQASPGRRHDISINSISAAPAQ
jgi:hypothetical protein